MSQRQALPLFHLTLATLISLILFGLSHQGLTLWISQPINSLLTPLQYPFAQTQRLFLVKFNRFQDLPHQARIIKDLRRQNAELALLAQEAASLRDENKHLRSLLSVPVSADHQPLPARITSLTRFAIINQGSQQGVQANQAVVVDNILLGVITNVQSHSAQVRLLTDPETNLSVVTQSGVSGSLTSRNNQTYLTQVPQKDPLKVDEALFTRGSQTIPDQLLIGTIKQLEDNPTSVYRSALIEPAAAIVDLSTVFVLLD